MAYEAAGWHDFYVMTGGAAAALAGLLFVAMSLHSKAIIADTFYSHRAFTTLMALTTLLLLAAAVLIPGQPVKVVGAEVEAAAIFWLGVGLQGIFRRGPATGKVSMGRLRYVGELIGGTTWGVTFILAGLSLVTGIGGGFYLLAVVAASMLAWNIYVAWMLITEVSK